MASSRKEKNHVILKRLQTISNVILRGISTEVTHVFGDQLPDLTLGWTNNLLGYLDSGKKFLAIKDVRELYKGQCDVCRVCFNSEAQKQAHMIGLKHTKKMRLKDFHFEENYCEYCRIHWNSDKQRDQHLSGEKHRQNVEEEIQLNKFVPETQESSKNKSLPETPERSRPDLDFCKYCMVYYASESVKSNHLNGQKHKKRLENVAVDKNCEI